MADTFVSLIAGEKRPVFASATAQGGTLALSSPATFTLYPGPSATGTPLLSAAPASGTTGAGTATVTAYYTLDSATAGRVGTPLAPGDYLGLLTLPALGSDGVPRLRIERFLISVQAADGSPDYTAWPLAGDVYRAMAAAGVTLRADDGPAHARRKLDEVVAEVGRRTLRQFLPTTETRVFDGNGTPEMEIDEAVSVTSVAVIGIQSDPGYAISGFQLVSEQNKPRTRLVTARGSVPAYTSAGVYLPYHWVFPAGRQNISVTAVWGYAASIPADLWGAVCDEAAYRLAAELCFRPTGRVAEQRASDGSLTHFALDAPAVTQWHARYQKAIQDFKRPAGRRLRRLRGEMV